jgi:MerR family transcriptional regulator, light-induced transcriptional regulator
MAKHTATSRPSKVESAARHRSGAVARMLRMPVATLRVWERRYGVTQPMLSPSGQRLYSDGDVRRLALLKQLTDRGHAIGSLARLPMQQLQQVASTHASVLAVRQTEDLAQERPPPTRPWRVAVVGAVLAQRLQRPTLLRWLSVPLQLLGPFPDPAQAAAALQGAPVDALLMDEPRLHDGWLASLQVAAPALAAAPKAVLYRFASESTCASLAAAGTALLREPQNDIVLGQWLQGVLKAIPQPPPAADDTEQPSPPPPRRWDDAALAEFAGRSSTIACECPLHVTELLMQLSHFEAYSAECRHRNAADAELHAHLQQVAAVSRARFETALEYVALHEGLALPS